MTDPNVPAQGSPAKSPGGNPGNSRAVEAVGGAGASETLEERVQKSLSERSAGWLAWVPLPLLLSIVLALWAIRPSFAYESAALVLVLNVPFTLFTGLLIAFLVGRSFVTSGRGGLLLLGCGVLLWAAAAVVATVFARLGNINQQVTIHNTCVWLSALCHLGGVLWSQKSQRHWNQAGVWLTVGYVFTAGVVALVAIASVADWMPTFFVQGHGGTPLRHAVVGSAVVMFGLTAWLLTMGKPRPLRPFVQWYSLALGLAAVGLLAVMLQSAAGSLLNWTGRLTQVLSGAYMLIAALASMRESGTWSVSLEEALRQSESFYRQTLESIPGMVFTTRPDGYCDYQSQQWVDFTGVPLSEHLGNGWNNLLHPEDRARAFAAWRTAVEDRAPYDLEYRVRRHDGEYEWFKVIGRPIRDNSGHIVRWFGVAANIGAIKQAEERLTVSLREKEVLLKEIHHRVKNNLQVIASLVDLQAGELKDPAMLELFAEIRNRVRSMALVHEKLYQSDSLAAVDFGEYADELLDYLWRSHHDSGLAIRLNRDLQPVTLSVEQAVPCGLILNELVSNGFKHAFRGRAGGEIATALRKDATGRVILQVRDNGVGLPPGLDWRQADSMGLRLIRLLAGQLNATVTVRQEAGTEFEVGFQTGSVE
jgi:PAS domain S-box-containing protein